MDSTTRNKAIEHRHEVFGAIATADNRDEALESLTRLLSISAEQAGAILGTTLESLVGVASGTTLVDGEHSFALHPFRDTAEHTKLYATRAADPTSAPAGKWDDAKVEAERTAGLERIEQEHAMWFVAVDTSRDELVGLVFGEQEDEGADVTVAIWVAPQERKKGYGMHALKESRRALAAYFPGAHLVVRAALPSK